MTDREIEEILAAASTAAVSDVLDTLGVNGGLPMIRPLVPGMKLCGRAFTVEFADVAPGESAPAADYIEDVGEGEVVVIANNGRVDCTVWGDILSAVAQSRGVRGTVIDGACRDASEIMALGYPMFSRTAFMKSGKNRVRMVASQRRVTVAGTEVDPGDWVKADDSGVVVVPAAMAAQVAGMVREVEEMEARVLADVKAGMPLKQSRDRHGYNRFALKVERTG